MRGLAMVAANYGLLTRNLGTVSLIGPTRMDYAPAIRSVRGAAALLSEFVEDVYDGPKGKLEKAVNGVARRSGVKTTPCARLDPGFYGSARR